MTSQKLSGKGRRVASLTWTEKMRFTLDILEEDGTMPWDLRAAIFNRIFEDDIKTCGFIEPVPARTLRSQCSPAERRKSKAWIAIASTPRTPQEEQTIRGLRVRTEELRDTLRNVRLDGFSICGPSATDHDANTAAPLAEDPSPPRHQTQSLAVEGQDARTSAAGSSRGTRPVRSHARPDTRPRGTVPSVVPPPTTPLSKRVAIGVWNPELSDSESDYVPPSKRFKSLPAATHGGPGSRSNRTTSKSVAGVTEVAVPPLTPSKSQRKSAVTPRRLLPKYPYPRPDDTFRGIKPIELTRDELSRSKEPLIPVTEAEARPNIPPLVYRYWTPHSKHSSNSETGFVAGSFASTVEMWQPPPRPKDIIWNDVYNHIDRNMIPTPFISTSNALWWIIRLALKETRRGQRDGRISVIDTSRLDRNSVFYAKPYHLQMVKKFVYHNGAWHYSGAHEFLVYREIPGDAILKTFKVGDLLNFVSGNAAIAQALSLGTLEKKGHYKTTIVPELRARGIDLSPALVEGIAAFASFVGLNASDMGPISHFVSDVIEGWGIQLTIRTSREWAEYATTFEQALRANAGQRPWIRNQETRLGFLDGLRWGCSKHFNARHNSQLMRKMQKEAKRVGLSDPVQILCDELDAAKIQLNMLRRNGIRLIEETRTACQQMAGHGRGITEAAEHVDEQSDESMDDSAMDEVFEIGEDGLVV